jgi:integrase
MPGKRAKILSAADVGDLLVFASCTRHPLRNTVMVLFSAKAGLRAGEIANLTWDMIVDATGQISGLIELADAAAKKCSGRSIPVHPDLGAALTAWRQVAPSSDYVVASERGGRMNPLSIVVWFNRAFKNIGLKGCSSHSGSAERSSPGPLGSCTRQAARCGTCNCWQATGRSRRRSGTSTATATLSASWLR